MQQWVTRVYCEAAAPTHSAPSASGNTAPVEDSTYYDAAGGVVTCGPQRRMREKRGRRRIVGGPWRGAHGHDALALASGAGVDAGLHACGVVNHGVGNRWRAIASITTSFHAAPSDAAPITISAPTIGTGPDNGTHYWAVTFVTASGETGATAGGFATTGLTPAPATDITIGAAGIGAGVTDGTHEYACTFVTAIGETTPSPVSTIATAGPFAPPLATFTLGPGTDGTGPEAGAHNYAITFVTAAGETTPSAVVTKATDYMAPPTTGPTFNVGTAGTGPEAGAHDYVVTFLNSSGETIARAVNTKVPDSLTPPAAPLTFGAPVAGRGPDTGAHTYAVTYITAAGETTPGALSTMTSAGYLVTPPTAAPSIGNNTTLSNINGFWNPGDVIYVALAYYTQSGGGHVAGTTLGPVSNAIVASHHFNYPGGSIAPLIDIVGIVNSLDPAGASVGTRIYYNVNGCGVLRGSGPTTRHGPGSSPGGRSRRFLPRIRRGSRERRYRIFPSAHPA